MALAMQLQDLRTVYDHCLLYSAYVGSQGVIDQNIGDHKHDCSLPHAMILETIGTHFRDLKTFGHTFGNLSEKNIHVLDTGSGKGDVCAYGQLVGGFKLFNFHNLNILHSLPVPEEIHPARLPVDLTVERSPSPHNKSANAATSNNLYAFQEFQQLRDVITSFGAGMLAEERRRSKLLVLDQQVGLIAQVNSQADQTVDAVQGDVLAHQELNNKIKFQRVGLVACALHSGWGDDVVEEAKEAINSQIQGHKLTMEEFNNMVEEQTQVHQSQVIPLPLNVSMPGPVAGTLAPNPLSVEQWLQPSEMGGLFRIDEDTHKE